MEGEVGGLVVSANYYLPEREIGRKRGRERECVCVCVLKSSIIM